MHNTCFDENALYITVIFVKIRKENKQLTTVTAAVRRFWQTSHACKDQIGMHLFLIRSSAIVDKPRYPFVQYAAFFSIVT